MQLVVRTPHGDADVAIETSGVDVTLGDVVEATVGRAPATARVDGRTVPTTTPLGSSGALIGSTIDLGEPTALAEDTTVAVLVQIAGPGAGARARLSAGTYALGPSRRVNAHDLSETPVDEPVVEIDADDTTVTVRLLHGPTGHDTDPRPDNDDATSDVPAGLVEAHLDGDPLETQPVAWVSGPLALSGRVFELRRNVQPSATSRRFSGIGSNGTAAFNRPPRPAPPAEPAPLQVPDGGGEVREARKFPLIAMLAPLPIAVGMAVLLGSPRFLLFGLMSPVMAGSSWISERRQRKRDLGKSVATDAGAVADFTREAHERHRQDRDRLAAGELDIADLVELAADASPQLWARRPGDHDVFRVGIGLGDIPWQPPLDRSNSSLASADSIIADLGPLRAAPITADLLSERGIGVVGDRDFTSAMARGLILHACCAHGPADLDIILLTSPERRAEWEWIKWLPHIRTGGSPRILSNEDQIRSWAVAAANGWEAPSRPSAPSHITLVVVDEPEWWRQRTAPLRSLFGNRTIPLRFLSITESVPDVPAVCTTLVIGEPGNTATVEHLLGGRTTSGIAPFMVTEALASQVARQLAPLDDPDLPMAAESSLPSVVPIARLLELDSITAGTIRQRWNPGRRASSPAVVAGISERGPLTIDLVEDGPHGLVAGTTGAGKSELLRSLIVGLAANLQPDEINFVLVDFKGGSAFDACAELPHTVGMVTDLDEHLAGRVLRCLRAELHHRELVLRAAGATSLIEYQQLDGVEPLPRLVLVVDEFASVVAELPEFLPSLVDIAQRGRSLGIHMILATQRPAGVVDNKIKANTNLRIALRVQDDGDSLDVIGSRDAANLPRKVPGRAYARFAAGELTQFQSAYATGHSDDEGGDMFSVEPYVVGRRLTPIEDRLAGRSGPAPVGSAEGETDLERLVDAIGRASDDLGQSSQRQPAPPPLPEHLPLVPFLDEHHGEGVPVGLSDLPDEQRQTPHWWQPGPAGSLIAYGISGAGTSSLLITAALGAAGRSTADDLHIFVIDADTNSLAPLAALPHCGGVVRLDESERLVRLARLLGEEVDRRKLLAIEQGGPQVVARTEPTLVLFIDNVGALRQMLDEDRELDGTWQELERALRDGQPLGICALITAKQERAVPTSLATQIPDRLVMRLGDQFAYAGFGLRPNELPTFVTGRALRPDDKVEVQLAEPPADLAGHIAQLGLEAPDRRSPMRVDAIPASISIRDVVTAGFIDQSAVHAGIGLDTRTAKPALASIAFGESFFVTGAARSGRSSLLVAIAQSVHHADNQVPIFTIAPRGGPLRALTVPSDAPGNPGEIAGWVDRIEQSTDKRIVLVDDADRLAGPSIEQLGQLVDDGLIVVVAGRADALRAMGHWSRPLQRFRNGALIRPTAVDGELLRTSLGARLPRFARHRGLLVNDGEISPFLAAIVDTEQEST